MIQYCTALQLTINTPDSLIWLMMAIKDMCRRPREIKLRIEGEDNRTVGLGNER